MLAARRATAARKRAVDDAAYVRDAVARFSERLEESISLSSAPGVDALAAEIHRFASNYPRGASRSVRQRDRYSQFVVAAANHSVRRINELRREARGATVVHIVRARATWDGGYKESIVKVVSAFPVMSAPWTAALRRAFLEHVRRKALVGGDGYTTRIPDDFELEVRRVYTERDFVAPPPPIPGESKRARRRRRAIEIEDEQKAAGPHRLRGLGSDVHFPNVSTRVDYESALGTEQCGYAILLDTLGLSRSQVQAILGVSSAQNSLSGEEMLAVFKSQSRAVIIVGMQNEPILAHSLDQSLRGEDRIPTVLVYGASHWHVPSAEFAMRALASRRRQADTEAKNEYPEAKESDDESEDEKVAFEPQPVGEWIVTRVPDVAALVEAIHALPAAVGVAELKLLKKAVSSARHTASKQSYRAGIAEKRQAALVAAQQSLDAALSATSVRFVVAGREDVTDVWQELIVKHRIAYTWIEHSGVAVKAIHVNRTTQIIGDLPYATYGNLHSSLGIPVPYDGQTPSQMVQTVLQMATGRYKLEASTPNRFVSKAIGFRGRAGTLFRADEFLDCDPKSRGRDVHAVDFYRQYASIAREGSFPVVDEMSELLPTTDDQLAELAAGRVDDACMYVIQPTVEAAVWIGHGLTDAALVRTALAEGMLSPNEVVMTMRVATSASNAAVVRRFIDIVYEAPIADKWRKKLVNWMLGQFICSSRVKVSYSKLAESRREMSFHFHSMRIPVEKRQVEIIEYERADRSLGQLYHIYGSHVIRANETHQLINMVVVQRARARLLALSRRIVREVPTARLLYANTDGVTFTTSSPFEGPRLHVDEPTFGDIRRDEPYMRQKEAPHALVLKCNVNYPFPIVVAAYHPLPVLHDWRDLPGGDQKEVDIGALVGEGARMLVTGGPGTGKSYTTRRMAEHFLQQGKRVAIMAPTHTAADNVGGKTCHSCLSINVRTGKAVPLRLNEFANEFDVAICDEASMASRPIYNALTALPDTLSVFLVADYGQLAPVLDETNYEQTQLVRSLVDYNRLTLTHQHRSDGDYVARVAELCREDAPALRPADVAALPGVEVVAELTNEQILATEKFIYRWNRPRIAMNQRATRIKGQGHAPEPLSSRGVVLLGAIQKTELPDCAILHHLIRHRPASFSGQLDMAKRYLARARLVGRSWQVQVAYEGKDGKRLRVKEGVGAQAFPKEVRAAVFGGQYVDLDMAHSHAHMLREVARELKMPAPVMETLDLVIAKREKILALIAATGVESPKQELIRSLNGGRGASSARYGAGKGIDVDVTLCEIESAAKLVARRLSDRDEDQYITHVKSKCEAARRQKSWEINPRWTCEMAWARELSMHRDFSLAEENDTYLFSFLALAVFAKERQVMDVVLDTAARLTKDKRRHEILVFDGVMFPKDKVPDLRKLEAAVKKQTGYVVSLVAKPMSHSFDLSGVGEFSGVTASEADEWTNESDLDEMPIIFEGMRVAVAETRRGWGANREYEVKRRDAESVTVGLIDLRTGDVGPDVAIPVAEFKDLMRPAYCITQHKVQGQDLRNYAIFQLFDTWRPNGAEERVTDQRGAYVSLTRKMTGGHVLVVGL